MWAKPDARYVVAGCGRLGAEVALALARESRGVTVIDRDPAAFAALGPAFDGACVRGSVFDRAVLDEAGLAGAAGFAALTGDDRTNALAAHVARTVFGVARVTARLVDRAQAATYEQLGVTVIAPGAWGAQRARALLLAGSAESRLELGSGEVVVVERAVPEHAAGRPASALAVPGEIVLVALVREGHAFVPSAGTRLEAGDVAVLGVAAPALRHAEELLEP